jgi:RHS repeat-associated protein
VSTAAYNGADEPISATDATNRTVTYGYDNAGRAASTTDAAGLTSTKTYDLAGRMTGTAQASGGQQQRASTVGYDGNGNVLHAVSAEGRTVDYGYDFLNRLVKQVEKVDATKSMTTWTGYDRLGNRSHFVDGNGNATEYTYTPWGTPESVVEPAVTGASTPADRTWTTSYDAAGRAAKLVAPGGVTRTRDYDDQDRLYAEHGAGAENATADRTYGYDPAGRLTKIGSPGGDTNYRYDDRGNLRMSQGATGNAVYTYNGDGTLATRADAAGTTTFTYDGAGRVSSAADPLTGRTTDYKYDAVGRLSLTQDRAVAGRIMRTIGYDKLGRLASDNLTQLTDVGSRVLLGDNYGYDNDDKVTTKTSTRSVGVASANSYDYDGAGRLKSWTAGAQSTTYGWDDAGNRTSVNGSAYTYNERNQLLSGGGATYAYQKRGTVQSVTRGAVATTNGFDAFDRLVREGAATYQYDSDDRVLNRNGTALTYDGLSNETVTDGSRTVSRLPDGTALADKGAAGAKSLFADRHGDVVGRYLGAVVDGQRTYDPFGTVTSSSGETSNLGYQGDWTTPDTGKVNMTARWYDPARGGFLSRDDWNLDPNPSAAANRYTYGNGDAVGNTDPSGHSIWNPFEGAPYGNNGDDAETPKPPKPPKAPVPPSATTTMNGSGGGHGNGNGHGQGPRPQPGGTGSNHGGSHGPPPPPQWQQNAWKPAPTPNPGQTVRPIEQTRPGSSNPDFTPTETAQRHYAEANQTTAAPPSNNAINASLDPVTDCTAVTGNVYHCPVPEQFVPQPPEDEWHFWLPLFGMAPGIGAFADVSDAGRYLDQGDWDGFWWAMIAAVPGIGDGIAGGKMIYRAMKEEGGMAAAGPVDSRRYLGPKLEGNGQPDIKPDANGWVHPNTGGVSVAPNDVRNLPDSRFPRELGGRGADPAWCMSTCDLPPGLQYRPDPKRPSGHGFLEPSRPMPLAEYQRLLEDLKSTWSRVRPVDPNGPV